MSQLDELLRGSARPDAEPPSDPDREPPRASGPRRLRRALPLVRVLADTAALAVICNAALELAGFASLGIYPWQYRTPAYPAMFALGCGVVWAVVGLVHAVVGRFWATILLCATLTAAIGFADYEKLRLRREPVYPSDWEYLRHPAMLDEMIGGHPVLLPALLLPLLAAVTWPAVRALRRRRAARACPADRAPARRTRVTARVVTATLCLTILAGVAGFNKPGNPVRAVYDAAGADWQPWSQYGNYLSNGFVGGFLFNLPVPPMARPADYGPAEMARIVARYRALARRTNRTRDPHALDDVNVVMVLSESFSDPEAVHGVHLARDPIPFTRRLMARTTSGRMLAQDIGGGTANMEFEALTGMSMAELPPQDAIAYQQLVPGLRTFPSAARWLEQHGHRAIAVHPFNTGLYRRREVYPILGFDDFIYDQKMHEQRRIGHDAFISDASAFDEVRRQIAASREPLFVNLVTMQNHLPYAGRYDDPVPVTGPGGAPLSDLGQYARGLEHTDHALRRFLEGLRRSGEKTVVVFYGDHLPGGYPPSVFRVNSDRAMHQTPFFVWADFPGPRSAQPTTSPSHFMDLVLQRAGAAVPPYYALLGALRHQVPAMDGGVYVDGHDRTVRRDQLSPQARQLLHDYRLVQYDLSVGRRYSARAMFAPVG